MGEIVNLGYAPNAVESIIIKDARGNDVTLNYDITVIEGVLTVLPED
jgi:hypothetical protein